MITDQKHRERMATIPEKANEVHDSALGLLDILKRLSINTGRNTNKNLLKFEDLIQGYKNG